MACSGLGVHRFSTKAAYILFSYNTVIRLVCPCPGNMDRVAKLDWLNCQISLWDVPDVTYSIYIVALVSFGGNSILITKPCTSLHELMIPTLKDQPDQCLIFELARMLLRSLFSWSSLFPLPVCHIWSIAWQMSVAIDCRFQTCVVFEILLICNLAFCQHCAWWL